MKANNLNEADFKVVSEVILWKCLGHVPQTDIFLVFII